MKTGSGAKSARLAAALSREDFPFYSRFEVTQFAFFHAYGS
jgi:hypothetical protein